MTLKKKAATRMPAAPRAYTHAFCIIRFARTLTCLTSILNNEGTLADRLRSFDTPAAVGGQKHLYLRRLKLMKGPAATPCFRLGVFHSSLVTAMQRAVWNDL